MIRKIILILIMLLGMMFLIAYHAVAESPTEPPKTPMEYAGMRITQEFGIFEWEYFNTLVERESQWRPNAQNSSSTAFGIMQFLDDTWDTVGCTKTDNPYLQIDCGIKYIKKRHDTPRGAIAFHNKRNWY